MEADKKARWIFFIVLSNSPWYLVDWRWHFCLRRLELWFPLFIFALAMSVGLRWGICLVLAILYKQLIHVNKAKLADEKARWKQTKRPGGFFLLCLATLPGTWLTEGDICFICFQTWDGDRHSQIKNGTKAYWAYSGERRWNEYTCSKYVCVCVHVYLSVWVMFPILYITSECQNKNYCRSTCTCTFRVRIQTQQAIFQHTHSSWKGDWRRSWWRHGSCGTSWRLL